MKQFIKKYLSPTLVTLVVFAAGMGVGFFAVTQVASAQSDSLKNAACEGVELGGGTNCANTDPNDPNSATGQINSTLETVINILSIIVGIAAVIMIIIGGFRYITSAGDSGNVSAAKNTILYAIIGLVVVALAQFIVQFVLTAV